MLFGPLDEAHLNETVGISGDVMSRDVAFYFAAGMQLLAATNGSNVNWNNVNGNAEPDVADDLDNSGNMSEMLHSFVDWPALNLRFQCTGGYGG